MKNDPRKTRWFKWYHLYYFLAAFDVLTISATLYLNHTILGIYSQSVENDAVWSERVSQFSRLNERAAAVNAPGNDAFDSGEISADRLRLDKTYQEFQQATTAARDDLQRNSSQDVSAELLRILDQIDGQVALNHKEAIAVFAELENNNREAAGSRMAEMDRCFSRSLSLIGTLCEEVRQIQSARFDFEMARAQRLGRFEFAIAGAVCLILCVVTWYGHKMAEHMRRSESRISASEERLAFALEATTEGLWDWNIATGHVFFSPAWVKSLGYDEEDVEPHVSFWESLVHPDDLAKVQETLRAHFEGRTSHYKCENRLRTKSGEYRWNLDRGKVVVRDDNGKPLRMVGTDVDITENKRQRIELKNAKEVSEDANRAKSEFLANMSHEIRTPMTAILGFTDILLARVVKPENIDAARTVKENGRYLLELINDILDLSKIEAGKIEVEQITCSPNGIVADVSSLMRVRASAKGLQLEVHFDGSIPETIQSDPTRLRQILINIVGNAIKFTEMGSVKLVTHLLNGPGEEPKLRFDVIDTGIGIAEDVIEKLFQPFTQADSSTTRRFGGTGLGLTISRRLVELLGGEISVSSTVGKGSTFSVTVSTGPLENVRLIHDAVESVGNSVVAKAAAETEAPLLNRRILLAEDGPDNQRLIGFILKRAGAEVTLADNGQIGFDLATAAMTENRPFDVILMDMQMPVLDGYETARRLRNDGYSGPILALTAHAMSTDRQKCIDAGCDDYLAKPIDRKTLVELVRDYANTSAADHEVATVVEDEGSIPMNDSGTP